MIAAGESSPPQAPVGTLRKLLSRDGWPALAACLATVAVELGVFLALWPWASIRGSLQWPVWLPELYG